MTCPHCERAELKLIEADEPWHGEYLICPICDSTYNEEESKLMREPARYKASAYGECLEGIKVGCIMDGKVFMIVAIDETDAEYIFHEIFNKKLSPINKQRVNVFSNKVTKRK